MILIHNKRMKKLTDWMDLTSHFREPLYIINGSFIISPYLSTIIWSFLSDILLFIIVGMPSFPSLKFVLKEYSKLKARESALPKEEINSP